MALESPLDRLIKQIQAAQGIKQLFEPSMAQQRRNEYKRQRHEKILKRYSDRLENEYDNDVVQSEYADLRQYYQSNLSDMDENTRYLFEETDKDFKNHYEENTQFGIYMEQFPEFRQNLENNYGLYYNSLVDMPSELWATETIDNVEVPINKDFYIPGIEQDGSGGFTYTSNGTTTSLNAAPQSVRDNISTNIANLRDGYKKTITDGLTNFVSWVDSGNKLHPKRLAASAYGPDIENFKEISIQSLAHINDSDGFTRGEFDAITSAISIGSMTPITEWNATEQRNEQDYITNITSRLTDAAQRYPYLIEHQFKLSNENYDWENDPNGYYGTQIMVGEVDADGNYPILSKDNRMEILDKITANVVNDEVMIKTLDKQYYDLRTQSYINPLLLGEVSESQLREMPWLQHIKDFQESNLGYSTGVSSQTNNITGSGKQDISVKKEDKTTKFVNNVNIPTYVDDSNYISDDKHSSAVAEIEDLVIQNGIASREDGILKFDNSYLEGIYNDMLMDLNTSYSDFVTNNEISGENLKNDTNAFIVKDDYETDDSYNERIDNYSIDNITETLNDFLYKHSDFLSNAIDNRITSNTWSNSNDFNRMLIDYPDDYFAGDSDKISMYGYDAEGILNIPTDGSSGAEIGLNNFKEKISSMPTIIAEDINNKIVNGDYTLPDIIQEIEENEKILVENKNKLKNQNKIFANQLEQSVEHNPVYAEKVDNQENIYREENNLLEGDSVYADDDLQDNVGSFTVPDDSLYIYLDNRTGKISYSFNPKYEIDNIIETFPHLFGYQTKVELPGAGKTFDSKDDYWQWLIRDSGLKFDSNISTDILTVEGVGNLLSEYGFPNQLHDAYAYDQQTVGPNVHSLSVSDKINRTTSKKTNKGVKINFGKFNYTGSEEYGDTFGQRIDGAKRENILIGAAGGIFDEGFPSSLSETYQDLYSNSAYATLENQIFQEIIMNEYPNIYDGFDGNYNLLVEGEHHRAGDWSASESVYEMIENDINPDNAYGKSKDNYNNKIIEIKDFIKTNSIK